MVFDSEKPAGEKPVDGGDVPQGTQVFTKEQDSEHTAAAGGKTINYQVSKVPTRR